LDPSGPVPVALIGAGVRGSLAYGAWGLRHSERARIIAVAEPDDARRERFADEHGVAGEARFRDWPELLAGGPPVGGVIVATPDPQHAEPAIHALELGLDVLLEKPVARTPQELGRLITAARASAGRLTVAHPLRHAPLFEALVAMVRAGRVGRVMTVDHVENVGYLHFAHSFVRGNWRRMDESAPLILAKACHDFDLLAWLVEAPWTRVASFGSLSHFRPESAPPGAPARCIEGCPVQPTCPFDSVAFYLDPATPAPWLAAVSLDRSPEGLRDALWSGPYGRCVYRCENDVADHQVTIIDFADGTTATLTVSAFTADVTRTIRVMGSHAEIAGNLITGRLEVSQFRPGSPAPTKIEQVAFAEDGHGGGDDRLMDAFVTGLEQRRAGGRLPLAEGALEAAVVGHVLAFAAEESRRTGSVVHALMHAT